MNSHWRFHRGEVFGFVAPPDAPPLPPCTAAVCGKNFDDRSWRAVDLPHDWSIEDLPTSRGPDVVALDEDGGAWRYKSGRCPGPCAPELLSSRNFDDSGWREVTLPNARLMRPSQKSPWKPRHGWFRRRFSGSGAERLMLGTWATVDATYVNGVLIGETGDLSRWPRAAGGGRCYPPSAKCWGSWRSRVRERDRRRRRRPSRLGIDGSRRL